uniref:Endonuclease exonuclease phosphatase domain containing protein n=1 Tax=Haemonchus contortus TaxID=6289 RepID=A0A7I4XWF2_HAECO
MAISTFDAWTLASEACIGNLMMQTRKIKYDAIGLTETRRHRPLHAVIEAGEELFLGTCDSRGVGGKMWLNPRSNNLRCLRTNIGLQRKRGNAFHMDVERLYREDHTFSKVIVGDFNVKTTLRRRMKSYISGLTKWSSLRKVKGPEFISSIHTIHDDLQFQKSSDLRWS